MSSLYYNISIEGTIGVGKTSLANIIAKKYIKNLANSMLYQVKNIIGNIINIAEIILSLILDIAIISFPFFEF